MSDSAVVDAARGEIVFLPRSAIKTTFFVRKELNEDRVLSFMELYEAGAKVRPVQVVRGTNELKDGRHRLSAQDHLAMTRIECELVPHKERTELIVEAFGENMGGALPPTRNDVLFVMSQLINDGVAKKQIPFTSQLAARSFSESVGT